MMRYEWADSVRGGRRVFLIWPSASLVKSLSLIGTLTPLTQSIGGVLCTSLVFNFEFILFHSHTHRLRSGTVIYAQAGDASNGLPHI